MEKYGFVYIWLDRKHKRYYIGCHWGNEKDRYICSSPWMKQAYKLRPNDFKRRILKTNIFSKDEMYIEELKWLNLIKESEISPNASSPRYYNLNIKNNNSWHRYEDTKTIREKISIKTKEAMHRPDVREKYLKGIKTRNNRSSDPEVREKRSQTMIANGKNKGKITVKDADGNIFHTTKEDPRWLSGELVAASKGVKRPPLTENHKNQIKNASIFKTLNSKRISCIYCGVEGNPGNISRYHNERCKKKQN
jgi:hypothetical protein